MHKVVIFALMSLFVFTNATAQISVGGHKPFYDESTQSLLFVTDSNSIKDLTAIVGLTDSTWGNVNLEGVPVDGKEYHFGNATANRTYALTGVVNGQSVARTIRFTSLPVLKITKSTAFTNDYDTAKIEVDAADGTFANTILSCKIKHRGGTTNSETRHKRNYKFKVLDEAGASKDVSFFGMREDDGWILDAGQVDLFRVRNKINHGLWLDLSVKPYYYSSEPKLVNGCRTQEIELFVNNEYRGIYSLMEPVDRKQLKLKKYKDKDGTHGVLYKTSTLDGTSFNDTLGTFMNTSETWRGWEAKYPEPGDDADTTDYVTLDKFIKFVVKSSDEEYKASIQNYIDLPLYNDYKIFVNVIGGVDNYAKNMYWSVYDRTKAATSKFVVTPWDMDATYGQNWYNNPSPTSEDSVLLSPAIYFTYLSNIDNRLVKIYGKEYTDSLEKRYAELRSSWLSYASLTKRFDDALRELKLSGAAARESAKWSGDSDLGGLPLDWDKELAYIKGWLTQHLAVLDSFYHYTASSGISTVRQTPKHFDGAVYNLQGQKVSPSYRGIVIRNGRKYFQK